MRNKNHTVTQYVNNDFARSLRETFRERDNEERLFFNNLINQYGRRHVHAMMEENDFSLPYKYGDPEELKF